MITGLVGTVRQLAWIKGKWNRRRKGYQKRGKGRRKGLSDKIGEERQTDGANKNRFGEKKGGRSLILNTERKSENFPFRLSILSSAHHNPPKPSETRRQVRTGKRSRKGTGDKTEGKGAKGERRTKVSPPSSFLPAFLPSFFLPPFFSLREAKRFFFCLWRPLDPFLSPQTESLLLLLLDPSVFAAR